MEELQVFKNDEFGEVRTILIEGIPWFVGKDVAEILGYAKPQNAVATHVGKEDKTSTLIQGTGSNYKSKTIIINESGLYSLILSSKLPTAQRFKHWVTSEVLPSIRKHGAYVTSEKLYEIMKKPESIIELLQNLLDEQQKNKVLQKEVDVMKPKADYHDKLISAENLINFRTTSKELGVMPMFFISYLLDKKYIYRDKSDKLHPYARYVKSGLFRQKEYVSNGHVGVQTLVTAKGRSHFLKKKEKGEISQVSFRA
ncbi:MAG: BRO family protein [Eubacteriales bacterium]